MLASLVGVFSTWNNNLTGALHPCYAGFCIRRYDINHIGRRFWRRLMAFAKDYVTKISQEPRDVQAPTGFETSINAILLGVALFIIFKMIFRARKYTIFPRRKFPPGCIMLFRRIFDEICDEK